MHVDIYGTNFPTPEGPAIRDYLHLSEFAEALVLALRALLEGGKSDVFNLSTGRGHSVRGVITEVDKQSGSSGNSRAAPRRSGDLPVLIADSRKVFHKLNWKPIHSYIETIVQTAPDWYGSQILAVTP